MTTAHKKATARRKILIYLNKTHTGSAREIARALQMSAATVRHHLRILVSDGRLEIATTRMRGREGRGRPEKAYSIPSAALGDNLSALSEALLTASGSDVPMETLAKRLAGESDFASQPLAKRLNLTIEKLNQMNYHARWEAGSEGPRFLFSHCPYAAIIERHPELCRMDEALLQKWMGQPAAQVSRAGIEGSSVCVFALRR